MGRKELKWERGKCSCCVPGVLRQTRYRKPFPSVLQATLWDQAGHALPSAESDSQESPSPQGCLFSGRKAGFAFTLSMRSNESPSLRRQKVHFLHEEEGLPALPSISHSLFCSSPLPFNPTPCPWTPPSLRAMAFPRRRPQSGLPLNQNRLPHFLQPENVLL